ncbi:MAG: cytochrome c biogenesis CcdA family protein [Aeromicrobium sp.]
MTDWLIETVSSGTLALALPVALLAGLVSFFSPCVMPLLPGYLSYVTGLAAQDLESARRGRMLLGSLLFVLGFTVVFVTTGSLFGFFGLRLQEYQRTISVVMGILVIALGLAFIGRIPFLQREFRIHKVPAVGLGVAPLLGVLFGVGWTPCIGPTLGAVTTLAMADTDASAGRGAFLAFVYCLGLGIPFILAALGFGRFMHTVDWFKRHQRGVALFGGGMLIVVGLMLVTGAWDSLVFEMRSWFPGFESAI